MNENKSRVDVCPSITGDTYIPHKLGGLCYYCSDPSRLNDFSEEHSERFDYCGWQDLYRAIPGFGHRGMV